MNAALRLPVRVVRAQMLVAAALYLLLVGFGPELLLLDDDVAASAFRHSIYAMPPSIALCLAITGFMLHRHRFILRALAIGSAAIDAEKVASLARVPARVTGLTVGIAMGTVAMTVLTPLRPSLLDDPTAGSLALLALLIVATGALPLYVAVRAAVARALELVPPALMIGLLEREERTRRARRRLIGRAALAIVAPVGFIAFGAALITQAHVRQFDEHSREQTAQAIALGTLDAVPGVFREAGRPEAIAQAAEYGFEARIDEPGGRFALERGRRGRTTLTTPLDDGTAVVEFQASALAPLTLTGIAVAVVAVLWASVLGIRVGRAFADDLTATTARVRRLRTDGPGRLNFDSAPPARYAQVAALDGAIDTLAARFRVFASAQEMAIEARAAGRRMRTLLFASVSHDLRNPLNSILGFAELVSRKPLTVAQRESLGFIQQSGRELLALIIVILDMAKLEAQRVTLDRGLAYFAAVVDAAVRRGTALVADPVEIDVGVDDQVGDVIADRERLVQAISLLVTHCVRTAAAARSAGIDPRPVPLTATRDRAGKRIVMRIADPNGTIPRSDLERLISSEPWVAERRRHGGLTLGLALSRLLVERHGGTLHVIGDPPDVEFELSLPTDEEDSAEEDSR